MARRPFQESNYAELDEAWQTCAVNCGSRCLLRFRAKDGKVLWTETDRGDDEPGMPRMRACLRGRAMRYWLDCPERLNEPLRRVGPRGSGEFEPIGWDEALDEVAGRIRSTVEKWGNEAVLIPYATGVWSGSGSPFERLMNCYGGHLRIHGDYSCAQLQSACELLYGDDGYYSGSTIDEVANTDMLVMFGANPALTRMGGASGAYRLAQVREQARLDGHAINVVSVDPYHSDAAMQDGDEWIPIRPGTDAAFVAGVAYVLISEGLVDEEFVHSHCIGYDEENMPEGVDASKGYKSYVLGTSSDGVAKTPRWAAEITGCPSSRIVSFAHDLASAERAFVTQGWGPQRTACGEQSARAICLLAILTGNIGLPGTNSGTRERLFRSSVPDGLVGKNPVEASIPAFLWSRAVADGTSMTKDNSGVRGVAKLSVPVKLVINHAGNALTNQHADINRTHDILSDEGLCEFIVGIDVVMNDSMRYADIVLPDVAQAEQGAIESSGNSDGIAAVVSRGEWGAALHDRRPSWDIARELAARLGVEEAFCADGEGLDDYESARWNRGRLAGEPMPASGDLRGGVTRLPQHMGKIAYEAFRQDPSGNPLPTPSGKIEIYSRRVADRQSRMSSEDARLVSPIPAYIPAAEGSEAAAASGDYPLQFISHHGRQSAHSSFANVAQIEDVVPRRLLVNPLDAEPLGVESGMRVAVENGRGALVCRVCVTPRIMPGVVSLPEGAWHDADMDGSRIDWGGCANTLTSDEPTAWAKGNPHNSCLVRMRLLSVQEENEAVLREGLRGGEYK